MPNGAWGKLLTDWLPTHFDDSGMVPLLLLNHPATSDSPDSKEYGRDDFPSVGEWRSALDARARLINILNGPSHVEGAGHPPPDDSEREFLRYLNLGFHFGPTADQDNHKTNWGDATTTRTGVIALALT